MSSKITSFYNPEFEANDVLKFNYPKSLIEDIKTRINSIGYENLCKVSPGWQGDISWLSPNSLQHYNIFNKIFNDLGIERELTKALNLNYKIQLYCGFIVKRSKCTGQNFHRDWFGTALNTFTFITPLVEEGNDLGMLYITNDSSCKKYFYKTGEAIIFAEGFVHSSMPSNSSREILLLSFTFGTDDMSLWPLIAESVQTQSNLIRLPNGDFRVKNIDTC